MQPRLKSLLPPFAQHLIQRSLQFFRWDPWQRASWSQEGEDQVLRRLFEHQLTGFYVDIGAHHPKRFSNTFLFYRMGWRGINIDAMPGSMLAFSRSRPRDINLEIGIGEVAGEMDYYVFNEPALNSFSKELSLQRSSLTSYRIVDIIKVQVRPLHEILNQHLPSNQPVDFLTVDVEGMDQAVLRTNDWSRFRPTFVLVEVLGSSMREIEDSVLGRDMRKAGYGVYAKCVHTVFFKNLAA